MSQGLWIFLLVWIFALGAVIGSFLNVVIYRLPRGRSIIYPPSHCPSCDQPIAWYDNIPIVSWFLLRGKCRHCRQPISVRYPLIEATTAVLVTAVFWASCLPGRQLPHSAPFGPLWTASIFGHLGETTATPSQLGWLAIALRTVEYSLLLCTLLASTVIVGERQAVPARIFLPMWILGLVIWLILPWLPEFGLQQTADPIEAAFGAGASLAAAALVVFLAAWFLGTDVRRGFAPALYSASLLLGAPRTLVVGTGALFAYTVGRILGHWFAGLGRIPLVGWLLAACALVAWLW
ncbi:MAG: prepilin peptidase [Thermoguttaceae bacterium]|nr:prepilin peptidase [Thermoguttaceae bacterium]MDW8078603.1 prepilin peptidase [Thermoguttaceae bacterium]